MNGDIRVTEVKKKQDRGKETLKLIMIDVKQGFV